MEAICVIILIVFIFYKFLKPGKRVEIDFTDRRIYGRWNGHVLSSRRFYEFDSAEQIIEAKKKVEKELNEKIKIYKKVKSCN